MIKRIELFTAKNPRLILQVDDSEFIVSPKTLIENPEINRLAAAFVADKVSVKSELGKRIKAHLPKGQKTLPKKAKEALGLTIKAQTQREIRKACAVIANEELDNIKNELMQVIGDREWLLN